MFRILVVEDSPVNMALTVAILESAGHAVLQADHAVPGMEMAREQRPDLILMDIQLPDIDGLMATRMLKRDPRTAHIPVIALTAHAMAEDEKKARDAGCDDFDTKPVDIQRLVGKMKALMGEA